MKRIVNRIYNDYFMGPRFAELEALLSNALMHGYKIISLQQLHKLSIQEQSSSSEKYIVLRHDIDTDVKTAKLIWELEKTFNVFGSFYFRLTTFDIDLMLDIHKSGGEVGYHFEEIATIAKQKGIRDTSLAEEAVVEAAELFSRNLSALRNKTGLPLTGIASHGDFVNRYLNYKNNNLLTGDLRNKFGIEYEAYDPELVERMTSRITDRMYPELWFPESPLEAMNRGDNVIQILIHPRQWKRSPVINTKDNLIRLYEGLKYRYF